MEQALFCLVVPHTTVLMENTAVWRLPPMRGYVLYSVSIILMSNVGYPFLLHRRRKGYPQSISMVCVYKLWKSSLPSIYSGVFVMSLIKREKSPHNSRLVRGSLILLRWHQTSVWKQVDLPVAESRSVLTEKGSTTVLASIPGRLKYVFLIGVDSRLPQYLPQPDFSTLERA